MAYLFLICCVLCYFLIKDRYPDKTDSYLIVRSIVLGICAAIMFIILSVIFTTLLGATAVLILLSLLC